MDDPSSRRTQPRARVSLRAECIVIEGDSRRSLSGALRDLSLSGAQLELPEPLPPGARIELRFRTGLVSGRVVVAGEVRTSARALGGGRVHVRFDAPLQRLERFIEDAVLDDVQSDDGPLLGPVLEAAPDGRAPRAPRLHTALLADVTVRVAGQPDVRAQAVVVSLSEGGARLCTLASVPRGATVELSCRLGLLSRRIVATGEVRWTRRRRELGEAGIAFAAPVPAIAELIANEQERWSHPPPNDGGVLALLRDGSFPGFRPPGGSERF